MRRPLSLITATVLIASSFFAISQTAVSANSTNEASVIRGAQVGPSAVPNAAVDRAVRLTRNGKFLIAGRDSTNANAQVHLWRLNQDLTIDTSFTAVDLGADFSKPTQAQSNCSMSCVEFSNIMVNEGADRYAMYSSRYMDNPTTNQGNGILYALVLGKLSTGEVLATRRIIELNPNENASDWASLNAAPMGRPACEAATGTAVNGSSLVRSTPNGHSMVVRPDGSLLVPISCHYSNYGYGGPPASSVFEHETSILLGLKQSGSTLVTDTSVGTNGVSTLFNDVTKCPDGQPYSSVANNSLSMTNLTDAYIPLNLTTTTRTATVPNHMANQGVTSYDGCDMAWNNTNSRSNNIVINIKGDVISNQTYPAGYEFRPFRWVIDPQGRWNTVLRGFDPANFSNRSNTTFIRLNRQGEFDTTLGANGMKDIQALVPSSVTINGTAVNLFYSIMGYATTATGVMFTGFTSSISPSNYSCSSINGYSAQVTRTMYPYYLTIDEGLVTSYGTNGLGEPISIVSPQGSACTGFTSLDFITPQGQHATFAVTSQVGSQPAGFMLAKFGAAVGVTGGGDGSGETSTASGRTDTKVYSRKLPQRVQTKTTLNVLTKKASRTQSLRSRTPKICVATKQDIVMVKKGTCTVDVVVTATNRKVRSLTTKVQEADLEVGTTVTAEDPITFKRASVRLSAAAKAQIAEIAASASTAKRIILVGHTALLTEATASNNFISLHRAARVKDALQAEFNKAGVTVPINIVSLGSKAPLTTKRTESSQSRNRRVDIYIVP